MPKTTALEVEEISTAIVTIRERLGELRCDVDDLVGKYLGSDANGEPIGFDAASKLLAEATVLRHETGWFVEDVDKLTHGLLQVRHVESETLDELGAVDA